METWAAFPVVTEACTPGDCDLEPSPESTWAFAPVLEHDDVPLTEFRSRFTRTEILEPERGGNDRGADLFDSLTLGGWLDYTHFNVSVTRSCTVGAPGCADTDDADDFDLAYAGGGVLGFMAGCNPWTTPAGAGSATSPGVMVGMEDLASTSLRRERPDLFLGDAEVVIDDLAAPNVDVAFTTIHNVTEGTRRRDLSWEDLPLEDGPVRCGFPGGRRGPLRSPGRDVHRARASGSGRRVPPGRHRRGLRCETSVALRPRTSGTARGQHTRRQPRSGQIQEVSPGTDPALGPRVSHRAGCLSRPRTLWRHHAPRSAAPPFTSSVCPGNLQTAVKSTPFPIQPCRQR